MKSLIRLCQQLSQCIYLAKDIIFSFSIFFNLAGAASPLLDSAGSPNAAQQPARLGPGTTIALTAALSAILAALAVVALALLVRYVIRRRKQKSQPSGARARQSMMSFGSMLKGNDFGSVRSKFSSSSGDTDSVRSIPAGM